MMRTFEAQRFTSGNLLLTNKVIISDHDIKIVWPDILKDQEVSIPILRGSAPRKEQNENGLFSIIVKDSLDLEYVCEGFSEKQVDEMIVLIREKHDHLEEQSAKALDAVLKELDELVGLEDLKLMIRNHLKLSKYYKESGENSMLNMHMVFKGNPGTGKTTVARIIGKIYFHAGILSSDNFIECSRPDLVGEFIGLTAQKTLKLLQDALDGILFIDEAYTLSSSGATNDFGKEAIETILKFMEDNRSRISIIVAGYPGLMERFLSVNPGLQSRFNQVVDFPDMHMEELLEMGLRFFKKEKISISSKMKDYLSEQLTLVCESRGPGFGNGRLIRNLCEQIVRNYDLRKAEELEKKGRLSASKSLLLQDVQPVFTQFLQSNEPKKGSQKLGY